MSLSDILKTVIGPQAAAAHEKARAYVRVSHERSAEKAISPETQRRAIENYANAHGYEIVRWYTDLAKSAFRDDDKRLQYRQMIDDAKADPLTTVILVFRYDRFSRNDTAYTIQGELLRHGVRIESTEEGYQDPNSEAGALMMPLTWGINRLFSIKLRNVVMPNMKLNFEQRDPGTGWAYKNGGWPMFGYKPERVSVNARRVTSAYKLIWLLDDREFGGKPVWQWARTMLLDWRLGERVGYDTIASRLTKAGVPTPSGRAAWSMSTVQSLLGNWDRLYQYAGYAFWNREDCTERVRRRKDISEWVVVPNAHPAIISESECDSLWAMFDDSMRRSKTTKTGELSPFALSGGFLVCAHCGANYTGVNRNGKRYYACGSQVYRQGAGCVEKGWYIPREQLEGHVLDVLLKKIPQSLEEQQAWVDTMNANVSREWQVLVSTQKDRLKHMARLRTEMTRLSETAAATGPVAELVEKIQKTAALLSRLEMVNDIELPEPIQVAEIATLREKLVMATEPEAVSLRHSFLKRFVTRIEVDAEKKVLDGHLLDPKAYLAGLAGRQTGLEHENMQRVAAPRGVEPLSRP